MDDRFDLYRVDWERDRTAEEWAELADQFRAAATRSRQEALDSFARSDTDGALSQWASDQTAQYCAAAAALADKHGMAEFPALFDAETGTLAPAQLRDGDYGLYWRVPEHAADEPPSYRHKAKTFSMSLADSRRRRGRFYRSHGYTEGRVRARARMVSRSAGAWRVAYVYEQLHPNGADVVVVTRDVNEREENTAGIEWAPGKKSARVTLTGRAVEFATRPNVAPEIHGELVRRDGGWHVEQDGASVLATRRRTWKASVNGLIRARGFSPAEFEFIEK